MRQKGPTFLAIENFAVSHHDLQQDHMTGIHMTHGWLCLFLFSNGRDNTTCLLEMTGSQTAKNTRSHAAPSNKILLQY